jgi:hypothetical protein
MVDKVEATKNLEILKQNKKILNDSYNLLFSSHQFKQHCVELCVRQQIRLRIWNIS